MLLRAALDKRVTQWQRLLNRGHLLFCPQWRSHGCPLFFQLGSCLQSELNDVTAAENDPKSEINCDLKGQKVTGGGGDFAFSLLQGEKTASPCYSTSSSWQWTVKAHWKWNAIVSIHDSVNKWRWWESNVIYQCRASVRPKNRNMQKPGQKRVWYIYTVTCAFDTSLHECQKTPTKPGTCAPPYPLIWHRNDSVKTAKLCEDGAIDRSPCTEHMGAPERCSPADSDLWPFSSRGKMCRSLMYYIRFDLTS